MSFNNPVLQALFSKLGRGPGVPTAQQQGLGQQPSPFNPQPPTPPLPQQSQGQGQGGQGGQDTGLLAILAKILQNPGVLNSIGQVGSAFAGRDQLADFQRVTQQKQQLELAKRARDLEEARIDISKQNVELGRENLRARREEEQGVLAREHARIRAAEVKVKRDNDIAIINLLIKDNKAVSEDRLVKVFGETARGVSISPSLKGGLRTVNIPEDRKDLIGIYGGTKVELPEAQAQSLVSDILDRPEDNPEVYHFGGVIVQRNETTGELEEVFRIKQDEKVEKPRHFPISEQNRIREFLGDLVDDWSGLSLKARNDMINKFWEVEQNGLSPQPIVSTIERSEWNVLARWAFGPTYERVVGIQDPREGNVIRYDAQGNRLP